MTPDPATKKYTRLVLPDRKTARRRVLLIAAVLFPLTWIVNALLIGNWNLLADHNAESYRHLREAAVVFVCAVCVVFLLTLLPQAQRFCHWLFSWRILRRGLITSAWVVTLIALFYGEQDWSGRSAWDKYSSNLAAQGEQLDFQTFIPQTIPDSENFAANPEVQNWFVRYTNNSLLTFSNWYSTDNFALAGAMVPSAQMNSQPERSASTKPPQLTDLVAWKLAFAAVQAGTTNAAPTFASEKLDPESRAQAAPSVLESLKYLDVRLEPLRAASGRPESHYPLNYDVNNPWGILLPHLANIKALSLRLDLRACAELAEGQNDRALEDVKLNLRLGDSLNAEPFLISYLVRGATLQITAHSIWEGLAEHKWSDAQLKELQALLARYDFIADMKPPFACERAAGIRTADLLAEGKFTLNDLAGDSSSTGAAAATAFGHIMPRGWYDREKLNYCRLYTLQLDGAFDVHAKRVFPEKVAGGVKAVDDALAGRNPITTILIRHQLLSAILLPALGNIPKKGAFAQATADQALLACALERYRLAHGNFPDRIDALVPAFVSNLPLDVITGEPCIYRRTGNTFILYSIGWNQVDDGGRLVMKGSSQDISQGDWVWQYPAE